LEKRSLRIAGHRTSLALEPEFWSGLEDIAQAAGKPLTALIAEIDEARAGPNLSSAVRIAVLAYYQSGAFPGKADPAFRFGNATNENT
jgi:predicted DNA-binding ribbon-helix-helix protein